MLTSKTCSLMSACFAECVHNTLDCGCLHTLTAVSDTPQFGCKQKEKATSNITSYSADGEIIARLPCLTPPETYADCMAYGVYDLLGCSAEDRAAGGYHRAPVLHIPSRRHHCFHQCLCFA